MWRSVAIKYRGIAIQTTGKFCRMAFRSSLSLSLFLIFSLICATQARLSLYPPGHDALILLQKGLGVYTQNQNTDLQNPCYGHGVFCEKRVANNSSVLRVVRIVYENKQTRGNLSPAIGRLSEIRELSLPNNGLVGNIPSQILLCKKLEVLNLQRNKFSGQVPAELSALIRLRVLDLSSNKLSGNLNFLKYFPNLEKLSLADNLFTGKIPPSLKSFRNLRFFNVSGNSLLEGPIPKLTQLEYLSADSLPKRYVLAERRKPNTTTAMAPSSSSSSSAPAPAPESPTDAHHHHKKKRKVAGWMLGFLAGAIAGTLSGFISSVLFKLFMVYLGRDKKDSGITLFSSMIKKAEDLSFLEKEDGLAELELIGRGGCGHVYKAEIPGLMIAIKKIDQPHKEAAELTQEDTKELHKKMRQIKSEIKIVGQIRHRNLLPLLAHVPNKDCHYLIYEYMKNGSLQDVLEKVSQGNADLDWINRHRIALGIAAGLEYLHSHSERITHRDLKPANILLDDDMEARITDFGLAKAVPEAFTHVTTSVVAGTPGFIAPEYQKTFKFTEKCDIYSFGVLLAVLVIGKLPSHEFFQSTAELFLVKWLRSLMISEDPKRAIDPKLMGNGYEDQMLLVLRIACFCTLENPKERPSSKDVRCMLSQIQH
nr:leucine-rich repeat receptor-like serine/threonine/tyrosine-protein kinase SOBIR1 [Ipomoea trifida]